MTIPTTDSEVYLAGKLDHWCIDCHIHTDNTEQYTSGFLSFGFFYYEAPTSEDHCSCCWTQDWTSLSMNGWQRPNHLLLRMLRNENSLEKKLTSVKKRDVVCSRLSLPITCAEVQELWLQHPEQSVGCKTPADKQEKCLSYTAVKSENAFLSVMSPCITVAFLGRCNINSL